MKLNSDILVFITFSCESQLIRAQNEKEKRNGNAAKCTAANEIVTPSTPHFRQREREREREREFIKRTQSGVGEMENKKTEIKSVSE